MASVLNNVLGWIAVLLVAPVLTFLHEVARIGHSSRRS
jgi:hypothetical protein